VFFTQAALAPILRNRLCCCRMVSDNLKDSWIAHGDARYLRAVTGGTARPHIGLFTLSMEHPFGGNLTQFRKQVFSLVLVAGLLAPAAFAGSKEDPHDLLSKSFQQAGIWNQGR
jgi:hypothetical protein